MAAGCRHREPRIDPQRQAGFKNVHGIPAPRKKNSKMISHAPYDAIQVVHAAPAFRSAYMELISRKVRPERLERPVAHGRAFSVIRLKARLSWLRRY